LAGFYIHRYDWEEESGKGDTGEREKEKKDFQNEGRGGMMEKKRWGSGDPSEVLDNVKTWYGLSDKGGNLLGPYPRELCKGRSFFSP